MTSRRSWGPVRSVTPPSRHPGSDEALRLRDRQAVVKAYQVGLVTLGFQHTRRTAQLVARSPDRPSTTGKAGGPAGGRRSGRTLHAEVARGGADLCPLDTFASVKDDGVGFDPATTAEGIGLSRSIRARVAEVGGRVEGSQHPGPGHRGAVLDAMSEDGDGVADRRGDQGRSPRRVVKVVLADDHPSGATGCEPTWRGVLGRG